MKYESLFSVGQRVKLETQEFTTDRACIRAIIFTNGKVRYSLYLLDSETTLHNVDSFFVKEGYEIVESMDIDNYS